jgi:hypothetical protein
MTTGFYKVNTDAMKQEHERSRERDNENSFPMVFLKEGISHLRVLPPYSEKGVWLREIREHGLRIQGKFTSLTCLSIINETCPICEEGRALYRKDAADTEEKEANVAKAKELSARSAFLFNVLVKTSPDGGSLKDGVKVLKAGATVKRELMEYDQDVAGGYGDITNLNSGFDVRITRKGQKLKTTYSVKAVPQKTDILEELTEVGFDIDNLTPLNLDEVYPPRSYDEVKAMFEESQKEPGFENFVEPEAPNHTPQELKVPKADSTTPTAPPPPSES